MKNLSTLIFFFTFVFATSFCSGQKTYHAQNDSIIGDWKGTSLCQIKNSPCHDEIAIYHVSKTEKENVYRFVMNKIVNGQEEDMGILDYTFDPTKRNLTAFNNGNNIWTFAVFGDSMHGTLISKNVLYRIIELKRLK